MRPALGCFDYSCSWNIRNQQENVRSEQQSRCRMVFEVEDLSVASCQPVRYGRGSRSNSLQCFAALVRTASMERSAWNPPPWVTNP